MELADRYLLIGIAAAHLAQMTVGTDLIVTICNGKLIAGSHEVGTYGVEPTDADWERLRRKLSATTTE